jgi:hypothetical protein
MSSLVTLILHKGWTPAVAPGRVIRFGVEEEKALTVGPIRQRVINCLEQSPIPLNNLDIADMVNDQVYRVSGVLRRLNREGLVEVIGKPGPGQRFTVVQANG